MWPIGLRMSRLREALKQAKVKITTERLLSCLPREAEVDCAKVSILWLLVVIVGLSVADAQQPAQTSLQTGITGHYRVGCWTAIRMPEGNERSTDQVTIVETLDGDGMRVEYRQPPSQDDDRFLYAIPGSEAAPLKIILNSQTVHADRFPQQAESPSRGPSVVPLGMPWIVSVGDPLGIDTIGANELLNRASTIVVSKPEPVDFPGSRLGYDGVDLITISASGHQVLKELNGRQSEAIKQWVLGGGRLFVTLGRRGVFFSADGEQGVRRPLRALRATNAGGAGPKRMP